MKEITGKQKAKSNILPREIKGDITCDPCHFANDNTLHSCRRKFYVIMNNLIHDMTQSAFTWSKLTIEALE